MTSLRNENINNDTHVVKNNSPTVSFLETHMGWFANKDGKLSKESLVNGFVKLGDKEDEANHKARIIMAAGGIKVKHCPFSMFKPKEAVGVLNHARDTRLFNMDGSINEDQWKKMCEYSEVHLGTPIITKTRFYEFLNHCRKTDTRWDIWPHLGEIASNGEWNDFFAKCTDYWKLNGKTYEQAVTLKTLRNFYENSPAVFQDIVDKKLPVPSPGNKM